MNPEAGLAWFRIALFITLSAGGLILLNPPGTAEFIISVATFIIGLAFVAVIAILVRHASR